MISEFTFSRIPQIYFGPNKLFKLNNHIKKYGNNTLLLTGKNSFKNSDKWQPLITVLKKNNIFVIEEAVSGEPMPDFIDNIVAGFKGQKIDVVVAIGGGSVIDAGKAISAMLGKNESVKEFLEGVGGKEHDGSKIPFIAVPTTAGTGSEATKNAVLREVRNVETHGFKKSLRHDSFIPDIAIIDPELHLNCPPKITAACGMDAFTQLLESYVSVKASPMTDALAFNGLENIKNNLIEVYKNGVENIQARAAMAYASFLSGITLANAGLGTVHGFASVIGGYFDIPHGAVCGILMGEVVRKNVEYMNKEDNTNLALSKYAKVGRLFAGDDKLSVEEGCNSLINAISEMSKIMPLPSLRDFGINKKEFEKIAEKTGNKYNPVSFKKVQLKEILVEVF